MAAGIFDITDIEQGVDFSMTLNTNITLTGATVKAEIRVAPQHWKLLDSFNVVISGNSVTLFLTHVQTSRLKARELPYSYDVFVYPTVGAPIRLLAGKIYLTGRVTKR